tara:strand:+ start:537 stop:1385 length:849 start_codon:yes stop_codon:yes gene_type:complete
MTHGCESSFAHKLNTEEEAELYILETSILKLRRQVAMLNCKLCVSEFKCKDILVEILQLLLHHYRSQRQQSTSDLTRVSILSNYYVIDSSNTWIPLADDADNLIEDLLHGSKVSGQVMYKNKKCVLSIDQNTLNNGMPIMLLSEGDERILPVTPYNPHMYSFLLKNQPCVSGLQCDQSVLNRWLSSVQPGEVGTYMNNSCLEILAAEYLRETPREPPDNVLFVYGKDITEMMMVLRTNPNSKMYFLMTGNDTMFAYVQINSEIDDRMLFLLPVGSVAAFRNK